MTDEELAAIEARVNAATKGPWSASIDNFDPDHSKLEAVVDNEQVDILFTMETGYEDSLEAHKSQAYKDAQFIAAARTDVPRLLAAVRKLRNG